MVLQDDMNATMRAILIDWLFEINRKFKFPAHYIHRAIKLFDIALEYTKISKNEIQALGCACISLIDLFFSSFPSDAEDWTYLAAHCFTVKKFRALQSEVLKYLDYNIMVKTYYDTLEIKLLGQSYEVKQYALFLADYFLHYYSVSLENDEMVASDIYNTALNIKSLGCLSVVGIINEILDQKSYISVRIKTIIKDKPHILENWRKYTVFNPSLTTCFPFSKKPALISFNTMVSSKCIEEKKISLLTSLGDGSYGRVFTCRYEDEKLAAKKFRDPYASSTIREIIISGAFNHPGILSFKYIAMTDESAYMLMEHGKQTLRSWINDADYSAPTIQSIALKFIDELILALDEFHSKGFIHRDLKPPNIIIFDDKIKIADFGCSSHVDMYNGRELMHYNMCTLWYRAPELLLGGMCCHQQLDIWSLGCIIAEIIHQEAILSGDCEVDQIFKIFEMFGTPDNEAWPGVTGFPNYKETFPKWKNKNTLVGMIDASQIKLTDKRKNILLSMFEYDPIKRPAIRDIRNAWFN